MIMFGSIAVDPEKVVAVLPFHHLTSIMFADGGEIYTREPFVEVVKRIEAAKRVVSRC